MLIEKLPAKDLETFSKYLKCFALNQGSSAYRSPQPVEELLCYWDTAKSEYLWYLMGEQFILEREVQYVEPPIKLRDKICNSCNHEKMRAFYHDAHELIKTHFGDYYSMEARALRALLDYMNLATNTLDNFYMNGTTYTIDFGNGFKIKIDENTKPLRALGKIAKFYKMESFEDFRLEHSLILNQKKLTGTLCLSIHPMDYVTMSDNASGWNSCMNWKEPGSYRMGTIEMMNSPMVIVAYLKSNDRQFNWYNGSWNDKHWRILIVVSPEGVVTIKGYPYYHEQFAKDCVQWILDLGAKNLSWSFDAIAEIPDQTRFEYIDKNWYYMDSHADMMYNDFGAAVKHWGAFPKRIGVESSKNDPIQVFFEYSGHAQCMCCGQIVDAEEVYEEGYVYCENCCSEVNEDEAECAHCGEWHYIDDMYYIEDEWVCSYCFDEVAAECALTRDYKFYENLIKVYLASVEDDPAPEYDDEYIYINYNYANAWSMQTENHNFLIDNPHYHKEKGLFYINRNDITEDGLLRFFGISSRYAEDYFNKRDNFEE